MEFDGKMKRIHAEEMARRDLWPFFPLTQAQRQRFDGAHWSAGKAIRFLEREAR